MSNYTNEEQARPFTFGFVEGLVAQGCVNLNAVTLAAQSLKADPVEGLSKNHDRAEWAAEAIHAFIARTGADVESAVQDVLTNLRHLCDRSGLDFEQELDCANRMYRQETQAGSGNPVR